MTVILAGTAGKPGPKKQRAEPVHSQSTAGSSKRTALPERTVGEKG